MRKTTTNKAKGKKSRPKTKPDIPELEHSKTAVLRSLGSLNSTRCGDISMLSLSSLPGAVLNYDWPSTKQ